ncbi:TrmH family RNA methyltransferase [Peptostreptococcus sp. D1]|uniref:TrmH family RNA methyltransferase n=1 Tax=Peptostreptococcus sp. D1 TaxID=72304 RepID=UPI0008EEBFD2|nr:RNA methyltransferase [Peptostreptococcus sp. D1]SFE19981.1 RNA methyltransferase, TrmH family [Peptostreptococcus sp. D1]
MKTIKSKDNEKIKLVKSLHKSKYRNRENKFFSEGLRTIELALQYNADIVFSIISESFFQDVKNKDFIDILDSKANLFVVSDSLFNSICTTENTQGVLAVFDIDDMSINIFNGEVHKKIILLDRVQDPGNVGTIIRTADAAGFDLVILTKGCVDIFNPKVVRATMGSLFYMDVIVADENDILEKLSASKVQIVSGSLDANSYFDEVSYDESVALVVGNEANGVNQLWYDNSDILVKIPMFGKAESLNVAISSAILMYKIVR